MVPQHDYEYIDTLQLLRHSRQDQYHNDNMADTMEDNKAVQNISVLNFVTGHSTSVSSEESAESKFFDDTDCIVMQPITYFSNPSYGTDISIAPEIEIKDNVSYQ